MLSNLNSQFPHTWHSSPAITEEEEQEERVIIKSRLNIFFISLVTRRLPVTCSSALPANLWFYVIYSRCRLNGIPFFLSFFHRCDDRHIFTSLDRFRWDDEKGWTRWWTDWILYLQWWSLNIVNWIPWKEEFTISFQILLLSSTFLSHPLTVQAVKFKVTQPAWKRKECRECCDDE